MAQSRTVRDALALVIVSLTLTLTVHAQPASPPPPPPPNAVAPGPDTDTGAATEADEAPGNQVANDDGESQRRDEASDSAGTGEQEEVDDQADNYDDWLNEENKTEATGGEARTFGLELEQFGIRTTWSGYGDLTFSATPGGDISFDLIHFNPIMGAEVSNTFRAEIELEFEHGGSEQKVEYAIFEYTPFQPLGFRAGLFVVPFGYFNDVLHPSFRWVQITRPTAWRTVPPSVWNDVGVQVFGAVDIADALSLNYVAWVSNGLGLPDGESLAYLATKEQSVRKLRDNVIDNNNDKAVGMRTGVDVPLLDGLGNLKLALSGYSGAIDKANQTRLSLINAAVMFKLADFAVNAEFTQSMLGANAELLRVHERGSYVQVAYTVWQLTFAGRWDYTWLRPNMGAPAFANVFVPSVMYQPLPYVSLRLEGSFAFDQGWGLDTPTLLSMLAFSF